MASKHDLVVRAVGTADFSPSQLTTAKGWHIVFASGGLLKDTKVIWEATVEDIVGLLHQIPSTKSKSLLDWSIAKPGGFNQHDQLAQARALLEEGIGDQPPMDYRVRVQAFLAREEDSSGE